MMGAIYAVAITAIMHGACVDADEQARYEQLAMLAESKSIRNAESYELTEWYEPVTYNDYTWEYNEPTYYAPYDASDGISAAEFQWMGVVDDGEHFYTWYSERVLPGGGLTELNENGRHTEGGFVVDGDGYIAVASCDYENGTVIDTPFGAAKVYDTGYLQPGQIDVYTSF